MQQLFDEPSRRPLPEPDRDEYAYVGLKAISSLIPGVSELFGLLTSPLARRRDEWFADLEGRLRGLEKYSESLRLDNLSNDPRFVSAVIQASQSAARTHRAEKLEALRNAVLSVAAGKEPQSDRAEIFIGLVDRFTPVHLSLLRFFQSPMDHQDTGDTSTAPVRGSQSLIHFLNNKMPGLCSEIASPNEERSASTVQFLDLLVMDLSTAALITPDLKSVAHAPPLYPRWTTHLGDDFLDFISPPRT